MPAPLPVDSVLAEIVRCLERERNLVIEAPPGAGKTTRVPPALLRTSPGSILVLEPRRIAARMAARRVAQEMGEPVGETIGYQVRFEEVAGPRTRLQFLTEGVLTRRLLTDPELNGVSVVVLDEFHERHLEADLALTLLRRLQQGSRPDLKLIVMSATLEAGPVAAFLGDCRVVRSEGRLFDIDFAYTAHSGTPVEEQVAAAVERAGPPDGDTLVFLPGAAEIRRAMRACEGAGRRFGFLTLPLHGDLSLEEQDRAVQPASQPKLIFSTNVAESSITIDGVTMVIDSGLARIASDSPFTGLPVLEVRRVSKASAIQRAGRAGRTRAGRVIRLYTEQDYLRRPDHDTPEILRRDLSQTVLELRAIGVKDLCWLEAPPAAAWRAAEELLDRLGAAEHARAMVRYPLHPRLARMIIEAKHRGAAEAACRAAALLSAGERFAHMDIFDAMDEDLSPRAAQIERQVRRIVRPRRDHTSEDAVRIALLAAYPDRVGRRKTARDVQLCGGKPAVLTGDYEAELLVAIDVEDRRESGPPLIRSASLVKADWLLDLFPDRISEQDDVTWNRTAERVEGRSALIYDGIVIDETRDAQPDSERAAELLAQKALEAGVQRFTDAGRLGGLLARVEFASRHSEIRALTDTDVAETLTSLCAGLRSFAELEQAAVGFPAALEARSGSARLLDEVAPDQIRIKSRQVRVNYANGRPPWIESRLQDFFGVTETPRIARGAVPVIVHLLAPNRRPVQVTTDLAGFWERLYPQVRRELSRRYPKHAWPEKPV